MFFVKLRTPYEGRISGWSSDGCSSDLGNEISRRLERAGPRISPIGEVAVDAQRIRIRPGRTDQRADLTNPGIPATGGERAELRIEFLGLQPVIAARGDDHGDRKSVVVGTGE